MNVGRDAQALRRIHRNSPAALIRAKDPAIDEAAADNVSMSYFMDTSYCTEGIVLFCVVLLLPAFSRCLVLFISTLQHGFVGGLYTPNYLLDETVR